MCPRRHTKFCITVTWFYSFHNIHRVLVILEIATTLLGAEFAVMGLIKVFKASRFPINLGNTRQCFNAVVGPTSALFIVHIDDETSLGIRRCIARNEAVQAIHHEERATDNGSVTFGPTRVGNRNVGMFAEQFH